MSAALVGLDVGTSSIKALVIDTPPERDILAAARERSLALTGLASFWHDGQDQAAPAMARDATAGPDSARDDRADRAPHVMAGYATPPDHAFPSAVEALAGLLAEID